jgi:outer membrane immunogenic protein
MKRILFGAVALSLFHLAAPLSIANAADMPVKSSPVWAPPLESGPLWEGIYVGGNIGGAWGKSDWCTDTTVISCETAPVTNVAKMNPSGLIGGGQFGDRWQWSNVVFGIEGMIDGAAFGKQVADPVNGAVKTSFDGIMSVTGSLGWAVDRFHLYGKGGWALTDMKFEAAAPGTSNYLTTTNDWSPGWTVGAGIEYMLIPHLIVGVEYDYYRFQPGNVTNVTNLSGTVVPCAVCNFGNTTVQTVVGRLSIQAGPPPSWH